MHILERLLRLLDLATLSLLERVYLFDDRMCVIAMASDARVIASHQAERLARLIGDGHVPRLRNGGRRVVAHGITHDVPHRDRPVAPAHAA